MWNSRKKDIDSRGDLELMLKAFYEKVFNDDLISHFFTEVVPLEIDRHLTVITDFWASVLLDEQRYRKNVMEIHQHIHQLASIEKRHLDRWLKLFTETVDEQFEGAKATLAKQRATSIATMMNAKLNYPNPLKR